MKSQLLQERKQYRYVVENFDGGLNLKTFDYDLDENETPELINFWFNTDGLLEKRPGFVKYNVRSLGNTAIYGLYRFYKKDGSTKRFIATSSSSIYYADSSEVWQPLTCDETLTANQRFRFAVLNDYLYMTNGSNKPLKWSGTTTDNVKAVGTAAPTSGSATGSDTGGSLAAGDYLVAITYYNSTDGTESNYYSLGTSYITGSTGKITVTPPGASSDTQVDYVRIYVTEAGGTIYYLQSSITDGTASAQTITSISTTTAMRAVISGLNADVPPTKAKYIASMYNRLWLANVYHDSAWHPSELFYSEILTSTTTEPEYFPSDNNYRDIGKDDGSVITGIVAFNDYLYIFKENKVYVLTDPADPGNSPLRELYGVPGCIAPDTICRGNFQRPVSKNDYVFVHGIIYYSRNGFMGFDGNTAYPLSEKIEPLLDDISVTSASSMCAFFSNSKYYCAYGRKYGTAGDIRKTVDLTLSTGGETREATYSTSLAYTSGTDAKNTFANTSADNQEIIVNVQVDFSQQLPEYYKDYEKLQDFTVWYKIYFSNDSGNVWTEKGAYKQTVSALNVPNIQTYSHSFYDSGITDVRLDYYYRSGLGVSGTHVYLHSVEYYYDPSATIKNDKLLFYDTNKNAWAVWKEFHANCFCKWDMNADDNEEYFGSSIDGYVYKMNSSYTDDGKDIFASIRTKYYDCKLPFYNKRFVGIGGIFNLTETTLYMDVFVDRQQVARYKLDLKSNLAKNVYWGDQYYGNFVWKSQETIKNIYRRLDKAMGHRIQIYLWLSNSEPFEIRNLIFHFQPREGMR